MFSVETKNTIQGVPYSLSSLQESDIQYGARVKLRRGNTTRRIMCLDGDEVVLRGMRSSSVFEAVNIETFLSEWMLMNPVEEE